jgi:hypothetical protein
MKIDFTSIDDVLALKPKGVFRIENIGRRTVITVHRTGEPEEVIICMSPGHANRVRQELTDAGMTGLVGDSL